jgi:hypothetical protein
MDLALPQLLRAKGIWHAHKHCRATAAHERLVPKLTNTKSERGSASSAFRGATRWLCGMASARPLALALPRDHQSVGGTLWHLK